MRLAKSAVTRIRRIFNRQPTEPTLDPRDSRTARVHLYAGLWEIAEQFGGLTNSALRRTNGFVKYGDPLSATIMIFTAGSTAPEVYDRLTTAGLLDSTVGVRNVWDELREMSDEQLRSTFSGHEPSVESENLGEPQEVTQHHIRYVDDNGKAVGQEHRRDDKSTVLTSFRDGDGHEPVIIHAHDGTPIIELDRMSDLHNQWITHVVVGEPAVFIADGARIASAAQEIRTRDFKLIHFVHLSHLKAPLDGIHGEIRTDRAEAFRNHDQFDIVAVQTKQQMNDMAKIGMSRKRMRYLPSELGPEVTFQATNVERDESKGIVVARLVAQKQVAHAIRAVSLAKIKTPQVTLDICGRGNHHDQLSAMIDELDKPEDFSLVGHVDNVAERVSRASFSLLTSKFEGLGLAVIESMAAGCVPISYDVKYGPSEIITSGVNGYIVPADDVEALAAAITEFLNLPAEAKKAMREAAVERAREFTAEKSYARWKEALEAPIPIHLPQPFKDEKYVRLRELAITPGEGSTKLAVVFADKEEVDNKDLRLVFESRSKNIFFQVMSTPEGWQRTDDRITYNFTVPNELFSQASGQTFDVFVRRYMAPWDAKGQVKTPAPFKQVDLHNLRWFRTKRGNFGVKCLSESVG